MKGHRRYQAWCETRRGYVFDLFFDCLLVPSPYASSFAGFVELTTSLWLGGGGIVASLWNFIRERTAPERAQAEDALPEDMSIVSLVGGGLIAGDSVAALVLGVLGLMALVR